MFRWYVINTYSGHENKVKTNLEHRIMSMNQAQRFRRVVVPTEQVIETKDGQKVQTEKRVLPGYVLVNMDLNDDAPEALRLVHGHDPVLEIGLHLVLVPGIGVDDVPAEHGLRLFPR